MMELESEGLVFLSRLSTGVFFDSKLCPKCSMYVVFSLSIYLHECLKFKALNVGKYSAHGASGNDERLPILPSDCQHRYET